MNLFTESGLLIKVVSETIGNEVKEQNGGFLGMLVATMDLSCRLIIQLFFQNENIIKMNLDLLVFYSRNNLPKIEDGAYVIHFDEYESIGSR